MHDEQALIPGVEPIALTPADESVRAHDLLRAAVQAGASAEGIERLVNLQLKLADRAAQAACYAALRAFRRECPDLEKCKTVAVPTKDRSGTAYTFRQETLASIRKAIDPALDRNGLTVTFDQTFDDKGRLVCVCIVKHDGGGEHRASFTTPVSGSPTMSEAQKVGGTLTLAMRYALRATLGLRFAEDDEENPDHEEPESGPAVTEEQAANLNSMLEEIEPHSKGNRARFLSWLGVERVSEIPASRFADAVKQLQARRANPAGRK